MPGSNGLLRLRTPEPSSNLNPYRRCMRIHARSHFHRFLKSNRTKEKEGQGMVNKLGEPPPPLLKGESDKEKKENGVAHKLRKIFGSAKKGAGLGEREYWEEEEEITALHQRQVWGKAKEEKKERKPKKSEVILDSLSSGYGQGKGILAGYRI
ncbi:hypothetical protein K469DRAFT_749633 [Zopfia rhizophila CBS 207.26]|uniref:Uncharacterized protein n=1 Tax=Zopfia rhizophila CBS 207.26 TaxID=1314779 RepID=A0A6A6E5V1_9PEZI|nr:hypothetical protein K469DRAFT_749633 [Zopfia rhizophila CBS 207.26]